MVNRRREFSILRKNRNLISNSVILRCLKISDLDFLQKIENDIDLWQYGSENKIYTTEELVLYISNSNRPITEYSQFRYVVSLNDQPIGFVDLFNYYKNTASIGIIIDKEFQNKGYGKESLRLLSLIARDKLSIDHLNCKVEKNNLVSNYLFVSSGYELIKQDKKYNFYIFTL